MYQLVDNTSVYILGNTPATEVWNVVGVRVQRVKASLARYKWYWLIRELSCTIRKTLSDWDKRYTQHQCVTLHPEKSSKGNVLLSYFNTLGRNRGIGSDPRRLDEFFVGSGRSLPPFHNEWECWQIATVFLEMGYVLDVISWTNDQFVPQKQYNVFVDVRHNMERLAPLLNKDCVKIQHIDTAHMLFHNASEAAALLALQQRRGITLRPGRGEMPNLGIEHANCATILGNEFTMKTFQYANKPLYRVPVTSPFLYPPPEGKDFSRCAKRFLWLGSGGLVLKGLDLVLEAFADMPEYHLTVCGPIKYERDFERAYYKELYHTPNIHTVGWVNVGSPEFFEIAQCCCGVVSASCSEGQSGSIVTCLHMGLLPVITYESGVDVHDFGIILKERSITDIQKSIRRLSTLSPSQLTSMAHRAWKYARTHHTRERFVDEYRKAIEAILSGQQRGRPDQELLVDQPASVVLHFEAPLAS